MRKHKAVNEKKSVPLKVPQAASRMGCAKVFPQLLDLLSKNKKLFVV